MEYRDAVLKTEDVLAKGGFVLSDVADALMEAYEAGKDENFANRLLLTREEVDEFEADNARMDDIRKASRRLSDGFMVKGVRWDHLPENATLDEWLDASRAEAIRRCGEDSKE